MAPIHQVYCNGVQLQISFKGGQFLTRCRVSGRFYSNSAFPPCFAQLRCSPSSPTIIPVTGIQQVNVRLACDIGSRLATRRVCRSVVDESSIREDLLTLGAEVPNFFTRVVPLRDSAPMLRTYPMCAALEPRWPLEG